MQTALLKYISELVGSEIVEYQPISGGDISHVYRLDTKDARVVVKASADISALKMFEAEQAGLQAIKQTNSIKVPEVLFCDHFEKTSFIGMEFVETRKARAHDFLRLGEQLGTLHQNTSIFFGWDENNFIGSLSQLNKKTSNWSSFYVSQRLVPQIQMAKAKGFMSDFDQRSYDKMYLVVEDLCPPVEPALLHGDLWSGNYLISSNGVPHLIDPAVYFGHGEVDLAMTQLFGGFSEIFYAAYAECHPPLPGAEERKDLYQLYYLLVHLNLFGGSYYSAVKKIVDKYF